MPHFLDNLRAKPPHYRRVVALVVVIIITGIIFLIWLVTLLPKISNSQIGEDSKDGTPRPFSALTEQARRLFENGAQIITDFSGLGEPIKYVQEENLKESPGGVSEEEAGVGEE